MARTARLKKISTGTSHYHLMSRTNDRRFLFERGRVKTELVDALVRAARFSGIVLNAYTALDNHFHVVCTVTRTDEPVPEEELINRVRILKGGKTSGALAERWDGLRKAGFTETLAEEQNRLRRRMNDISEFIKTFKEAFNVLFKKARDYTGSIWSGRFASTLVEGGRYFAVCKRYVMLNAVRAGIVTQAKDYRWSWFEDDSEADLGLPAGSVPAGRLMRRVAQVGDGKILGSLAFVSRWIAGFGDRMRARSVVAHLVERAAYSSHGWRLAKEVA